jgi:PAS domain S-box-containing protein
MIPPFDERVALRLILEGTATATGREFFRALVKSLAAAMGTRGAWVTEYFPDEARLTALAFWLDGDWLPHYETPIAGTPCEAVVVGGRFVHIPDRVLELYPADPDLVMLEAVSYMGAPLLDSDGRVLGHLAVLDDRPMPEAPESNALFRIFAARAAAELDRMQAEQRVREREADLRRVVDGAMDAIIETDESGSITMLNRAAERILGCRSDRTLGTSFAAFQTEEARRILEDICQTLAERPEGERFAWIPMVFPMRTAAGTEFAAEATLSCAAGPHGERRTIVLRDVRDRIEAEQRIRLLEDETDYLREELDELHNHGEILGRSDALLRALREIGQVAETDASVLILGETGTGKELVARAVHAASRRSEHPLIRVNCAALPASLIESELFGHEKGAFTGATQRREGRFALADRGSIFLDEVGELPLELQAKLLRVLQEGEFEPLGSSRTRRVDVRIIAATNRDLRKAAAEGTFREDLYYRLNVFPVFMPPLRERGDDIVLLATTFAERFARRLGRPVPTLTADGARRLLAYGWPGNVRELQNVVERAVITARGGRLDLDRALSDVDIDAAPRDATGAADEFRGGGRPAASVPDGAATRAERSSEAAGEPDTPAPDRAGPAAAIIRTADEMLELERENLRAALIACGGRVSGERGAARLLGVAPSTLASRMKALGLARPKGGA